MNPAARSEVTPSSGLEARNSPAPLLQVPATGWIEAMRRAAPTAELVLFFLLAVLRLYLTADRDITALNTPHDEYWYVHKANIGVWAGNYSEMSFAHLPTYALWLELLNTYGIPARLGIELAWIAATLFLATSVRNFARSRIASVSIAAFLLFHPYSVYIFDRALAETLLAVTVAAAAAAALEIWVGRDTQMRGRRLIAVALFSAMFAVSCNLRKEGITLIAPLLLVCALTLFFRKRWWTAATRAAPCPGNLLFVLPLIAAVAFGWSISALNYAKWGTFATNDLDNPGYTAAIAAIGTVDAGQTPVKVSITRKMLSQAYAVSPTLKELQPQMEGAVKREWTDLSTSIGAQGEIGTGWFYWALRDAAGRTGWHATAKLADQKYGDVARELRDAFSKGQLRKQDMAISSFLDPDIAKWLPEIPASLQKEVRLSLFPRPSDIALPPESARPDQLTEYVRVVGRRSPYTSPGSQGEPHLADAGLTYFVWLARIIGLVFVIAAIQCLLAACLRRRIDARVVAVGIYVLFCGARIGLFALLDASSWNGEQARYMLPLLPLLACAGGIGLATLPGFGKSTMQPINGHREPQHQVGGW